MSQTEIPDWSDMPKDISISTLCWEDTYTYAADELERTPTKQEVIDLFEIIQDRMTDAMGEIFSDYLHDIADVAVSEILKAKKYNPEKMNGEELTGKKYCHECDEVQETYWELNYCEKNPKGIDVFTGEHGNDDTCEDCYCNPESTIMESKDINDTFVSNHAVYERCIQCHQYFDSMVQLDNK